jgi:hypothetical protein
MLSTKKRGSKTFLLLTIAMVLLLASCEPQVVFFPLYTAPDLLTDDSLVGTWVDGDGGTYAFEHSTNDPASYLFPFEVDHVKQQSDVHLLRLGGYLFVDLMANFDRLSEEAKAKDVRIPYPLLRGHTFGRMQIDPAGAYVRMALLDNDWVRRQQEKHTLGLDVLWPESFEGILVSPTEKLQEFALQHAQDKEAFSFRVALCRQEHACEDAGPF